MLLGYSSISVLSQNSIYSISGRVTDIEGNGVFGVIVSAVPNSTFGIDVLKPILMVTCYWFLEEQNEYIPDKELMVFLNINNGDKPIYIGFGSMFDVDETQKISKIIIAGLEKVGKRAILSGMGKLENLPDTVFTIENIPHTWLF